MESECFSKETSVMEEVVAPCPQPNTRTVLPLLAAANAVPCGLKAMSLIALEIVRTARGFPSLSQKRTALSSPADAKQGLFERNFGEKWTRLIFARCLISIAVSFF